ncbi:Ger(x)C family spore germination protein [Paenibacillus sinopodophylli]|uniref:Ger(x)C family spore germination protein n=1 Tax=Paenibacillus sinopodophylli TaxID=1837342 RepID=UPI00110C9BE7|nr:Ger(x)C family spore germination protein [Paenibacillus sinopodophylli]
MSCVNVKKMLAAALLTSLCFVLGGCKGSMELNEIHIVHSVALDEGKNGGVRVTAEIAKLSTGGQQPKGMQENTFYLTSEASSLFEAARLMRAKSDRTLLWGHTTAIIFSADLARGGIEKQIEDIRRLRQFRNSTLLYVMEGKAYESLKVSMPNVSISSQALRGLSEGGESTALTQQTSLIEVYEEIVNHYKDISIPSIEIVNDQVDRKLHLLQTKGLFAFKQNRLVGFMRSQETKGYLRASGEMDGSTESLACGAQKALTFENIKNRAKLKPNVDPQLHTDIKIEIYADLNLTSLQCDNITISPAVIARWEQELNANIAKDVERYMAFSQKHKVDLIGIGEMIHRKKPAVWRKLKGKWAENYAEASYSIHVYTRVDHTNFTM